MSHSSDPAHPALTRSELMVLYVLAGLQFCHIVDFMIIMPLGPQIMKDFGIGPGAFGLLVSSYTYAAALSGIGLSGVVDRLERKRLLLWLFMGFLLATAACGLAQDFNSLLLARAMAGAFGGVIGSLVHTMSGDLVPYARRGQASGIVMGAFALATVLGVPLSLGVSELQSWRASFFALAGLSLVLLWLGIRLLPSMSAHLKSQSAQSSVWDQFRQTLQLAVSPAGWRGLSFSMMVLFSSFLIIPFITLHLVGEVGMPTHLVPLVYLTGGAATLVSSRLIGWLADRHGKVLVFRLVALGSALPLFGLPHLPEAASLPLVLLCTTAFFVLVSGRTVPAMALLVSVVPPAQRGRFMALNTSAQQLAMGSAALVAGLMIQPMPDGRLVGYQMVSNLAVLVALLGVWFVGQVRHGGHDPQG